MKLYETITADTWRKGGLSNRERTRFCLAGHFLQLYGGYEWMAGKPRCDAIREAIMVLFPERFGQGPSDFNDHPDTTVDDVLRVCKLADV